MEKHIFAIAKITLKLRSYESGFTKTGLVLEGGGMRGVFTCGVLDFMMDHHMQFLM